MAKRGSSARRPARGAAPGAGLALRLWMLKNLFEVNGDIAGLRGSGQESAAARPLCPDAAQRRDVSHADPAARLSALSRRLLPSLRDGELLCRGVRADCAGSAGLPAAGRICAAHCARSGRAAARRWHAVAGRAVSLHRFATRWRRLRRRRRSLCWRWPCGRWRDSVMSRVGPMRSGLPSR